VLIGIVKKFIRYSSDIQATSFNHRSEGAGTQRKPGLRGGRGQQLHQPWYCLRDPAGGFVKSGARWDYMGVDAPCVPKISLKGVLSPKPRKFRKPYNTVSYDKVMDAFWLH
jgi:hypothetical protein